MPFSKFKLDPNEHIEAMHAAFQRVCDILQLSCDREDPLTEFVLKIVQLAKAGERDPEILCIDVLAALGAPLRGVTPGSMSEPITSVAAKEAAGLT
jgi:hypothetical protein